MDITRHPYSRLPSTPAAQGVPDIPTSGPAPDSPEHEHLRSRKRVPESAPAPRQDFPWSSAAGAKPPVAASPPRGEPGAALDVSAAPWPSGGRRPTVLPALYKGILADHLQARIRSASVALAEAQTAGKTLPASAAAMTMFRNAVKTVMQRNSELTLLGGFVATADIQSPPDGTYFWSGDALTPSGTVTASARVTAQAMAKAADAVTLEQTHGGQQLNHYAGHANSFGYLGERFNYLGSSPLRDMLITRGAARSGGTVELKMPRRTVAGVLWDVMSERFAAQARGCVNVIHAAESTNPYFSSDTYMKSTWLTREKPVLIVRREARIAERFGQDLCGHLHPPTPGAKPSWAGTGGIHANIAPRPATAPQDLHRSQGGPGLLAALPGQALRKSPAECPPSPRPSPRPHRPGWPSAR